jgi:nucleotide-binding universal stress UspA family protein
MMYQKILAPLDGSELSECTLSHLKAVASGCQIPEAVLLHVVQPIEEEYQHFRHRGIPEETIDQAEKDIEDHARDYLSKVADRMKKKGIRVSTAIVRGRPADEILEYARKNGVDLIVMSTHGRSGLARWALGSVADRVLRQAAVPVLVIPPQGCRVS